MGISKSLVFLWVCKRASQSTFIFTFSEIIKLYPTIISRKTGSRSTFIPGEHSVKENILVDIKLGLMKNFVKALDKNGAAFQHLSTMFSDFNSA